MLISGCRPPPMYGCVRRQQLESFPLFPPISLQAPPSLNPAIPPLSLRTTHPFHCRGCRLPGIARTNSSRLDHVADSESLDRLVLGSAASAVGAAHGLDVAAAVLVAAAVQKSVIRIQNSRCDKKKKPRLLPLSSVYHLACIVLVDHYFIIYIYIYNFPFSTVALAQDGSCDSVDKRQRGKEKSALTCSPSS